MSKLSFNVAGRAIRWVGLSLCLVTASVWGDNTDDADAELNRLYMQWIDQFWFYLETSEHAQLRTASSIHLLHSKDRKAVERGEQLIDEVLSALNPDPVSLWLLASDCLFRKSADWCEPGGVYEMLMRADPDNAAVLMLRFSHARLANDEELLDTEANRQLLFKAGQVGRFDVYWGRSADKLYEEALKFVEINPVPPMPEFTSLNPLFDLPAHAYAFNVSMSLIVSRQTPSFQNLIELCRIQARNQHSELIKACKKLAQSMWQDGRTHLTRSIGYAIERIMLEEIDPDNPGVRTWRLRSEVLGVLRVCFSPRWMVNIGVQSETDKDTMMNWAKNFDALGEMEGDRLTAIQEYNASPDDYAFNPADCDKFLDLNDEDMVRLVVGRSPYDAWQAVQEEAGIQEL